MNGEEREGGGFADLVLFSLSCLLPVHTIYIPIPPSYTILSLGMLHKHNRSLPRLGMCVFDVVTHGYGIVPMFT